MTKWIIVGLIVGYLFLVLLLIRFVFVLLNRWKQSEEEDFEQRDN